MSAQLLCIYTLQVCQGNMMRQKWSPAWCCLKVMWLRFFILQLCISVKERMCKYRWIYLRKASVQALSYCHFRGMLIISPKKWCHSLHTPQQNEIGAKWATMHWSNTKMRGDPNTNWTWYKGETDSYFHGQPILAPSHQLSIGSQLINTTPLGRSGLHPVMEVLCLT